MISLRRQLIVDEHDTLIYPEGTACADVLTAGERGGSIASRVFFGLGLGVSTRSSRTTISLPYGQANPTISLTSVFSTS
jgi:uncharacterized oligopeptide transporter (OPT) family protein